MVMFFDVYAIYSENKLNISLYTTVSCYLYMYIYRSATVLRNICMKIDFFAIITQSKDQPKIILINATFWPKLYSYPNLSLK